jgi:hypothetical protein
MGRELLDAEAAPALALGRRQPVLRRPDLATMQRSRSPLVAASSRGHRAPPNAPLFGHRSFGTRAGARRRNAPPGESQSLEHLSSVRAAPPVVADHNVAFGDQLEGRPPGVRHSTHDPLDRLPKSVESSLGIPVGLMVRDILMNQTVEVDRSRVPLVIELLDDRFVLFWSHRSVFRVDVPRSYDRQSLNAR